MTKINELFDVIDVEFEESENTQPQTSIQSQEIIEVEAEELPQHRSENTIRRLVFIPTSHESFSYGTDKNFSYKK